MIANIFETVIKNIRARLTRSAHQISLHPSRSKSTSVRLTPFSNIPKHLLIPLPLRIQTQHFSMTSSSASRPASTQPAESCQPFRVVRGDLCIMVANSGAWIRLESPSGDKKRNCFNIMFDGGIMVTLREKDIGGICKVKLIVE